jgi:hypothetical protein
MSKKAVLVLSAGNVPTVSAGLPQRPCHVILAERQKSDLEDKTLCNKHLQAKKNQKYQY